MRGPGKKSTFATFDDQWTLDPVTGCHNWNRLLNNMGYGYLYVRGKMRCASRVAYERKNGEVANGIFVLHKCDNPRCVNPDHLFLGTQKENMQDCKRKGRVRNKSHYGAENISSKQVPVDEIKMALSSGLSQPEAAKKFNISRSTIQRVVYGTHWCTKNPASEAGKIQAGG